MVPFNGAILWHVCTWLKGREKRLAGSEREKKEGQEEHSTK